MGESQSYKARLKVSNECFEEKNESYNQEKDCERRGICYNILYKFQNEIIKNGNYFEKFDVIQDYIRINQGQEVLCTSSCLSQRQYWSKSI